MEYKLPADEYTKQSGEYALAREHVKLAPSEYYGQKEAEAGSKEKKLRRASLVSIASILAAIEIFASAAGFDFLGLNVISGDEEPLLPPEVEVTEGDLSFPKLGNLDPDFAGEYAWGGYGSEEYIRIIMKGDKDYRFIVAGGAWRSFGYSEETVEGASYDKKTNTLTLKNSDLEYLDVNLMGNGFTLKLEGDNYLGGIKVWGAYYGGSLTITGPGKLTVATDIRFDAEFSQTCLMVDAELLVRGRIMISATSMETAIYYKAPLKLEGGERSSGSFFNYSRDEYDEDGNYTGTVQSDISGITGENGERYYDYAIVDDSGDPTENVRFYYK